MGTLKVDTIQDSGGNTILSSDGSGGFTNSLPAGKSGSFRNIIINGDMSIAQRGTSETGLSNTSGYFTCDRWRFLTSGTGTWTQSQSTDVPTGQGFANSIKLDCTTANTQSSADYLMLNYKIEGQAVQYLKKGTANAESVTVSFWTKSNKTGTYTFELDDNDNNRSISKTYTVDSADTWEKKTLTFAGDTTGTLDNDNGESLRFYFWLSAGSDYTSGTLQTSWQSTTDANRVSSSNVYLGDSTNDEVYITGVQLETGTTASDFEFLPYDVNLQRCQRYCHRIQGISGDEKGIGSGFCSDTTRAAITVIHPVTMRAEPTITEAAIEIAHRLSTSSVSLGGDTDETLNVSTLLLDADSGTPFTSGDGVRGRLDNSTSAFLQLDAEL
jgi:hypothetical protein